MTFPNHMLLGAAIALTVKQPILVLPLAFASHFVLDVLPHYGTPGTYAQMMSHTYSYPEAALTVLGTILLIFTPGLWTPLSAAAALLAVSPDFHWISRYFYYEHRGREMPPSRFGEWHHKIQWCERPWGFWVELVSFIVGYFLVVKYLL